MNESGEETSISFTRDEHSTPANPRSLTEETTASKPPPTPPRAPPQVFAQNLAQGLHMPRSLYQFLSPPCRTCSAQVHIAMRRVASYAFETKATRTRMHTHTHTHTQTRTPYVHVYTRAPYLQGGNALQRRGVKSRKKTRRPVPQESDRFR